MKTSYFNKLQPVVLVCLAVLAFMAAAGPCIADDSSQNAAEERQEGDGMIRVTADRLVTDTQSQQAEFIGNVRAVRDNMTILCDSLKIFYQESAQDARSQPGEGSIRRIVAERNVTIRFDNQTATTQRAEWSPQKQTIVLSGAGSKISSGKNTITGSKITLHQGDNRIQVEGGGDRRVEAQIFSDDQGIRLQQ